MKFLRSLLQAFGFLALALVLFSFMTMHSNQPSVGQGAIPGEPTQQKPGDVNCDDKLDISDAVRILQFLFTGGEPPCAVAQGAQDSCCPEVLEELAALQERVQELSRTPGAEDIVILDGRAEFGAQGGRATVFSVPEDKWLVLTYIQIGGGNSQLFKTVEGRSTRVKVLGNGLPMNVSTGVPFPPGSEVVYNYPGPYTSPPQPFHFDYYLHGYLSDR